MFVFLLKSPVKKKSLLTALIIALLVVSSICVVAVVSIFAIVPDSTVTAQNNRQFNTYAGNLDEISDFVSQFSLSIDKQYSTDDVYIPEQFNSVYEGYNELQKKQGMDMEKYKGKKCTRYIFSLRDCTIDGDTGYINIIIYKGRVIGGHISSMRQDSRLRTFFGE